MTISPTSLTGAIDPQSISSGKPAAEPQGFGDTLKQALKSVNELQNAADKGAEGLQTGQSQALPEVMIGMEKADISMRLLVTMRNKVVDAYQEIMRMQV